MQHSELPQTASASRRRRQNSASTPLRRSKRLRSMTLTDSESDDKSENIDDHNDDTGSDISLKLEQELPTRPQSHISATHGGVAIGDDVTADIASSITAQATPMLDDPKDSPMPHNSESHSGLHSVHQDEPDAVRTPYQTLLKRMEGAQATHDGILQRMEILGKGQESLMGVFVIQSVLLFIGCGLTITMWLWLLIRWPAWRKEILMA